MLCPNCGRQLSESDGHCPACAATPAGAKPPSAEALGGISAAPLPGELQPSQRRSGKEIASVSLAPFPFIFFIPLVKLTSVFPGAGRTLFISYACLSLAAGILAIRFGHRVRYLIRQSNGGIRGGGLAITGLIVGYLGLAWTGSMIFASYYIPRFVASSRRTADQSSAVGSLIMINVAASIYAEGYSGFPATLAVLGPTKGAAPNTIPEPSQNAAGLIDENLAAGVKSNYCFAYFAENADQTGKFRTYTVRADPCGDAAAEYNQYNHYFTDQSGVIRVESGREANEHSKPVAAR